jgi:beta-galactosidase
MDAGSGWGGLYHVFARLRGSNTAISLKDIRLFTSADRAACAVSYTISTHVNGKAVQSLALLRYYLLPGGELEADFTINLNEALDFVPRAGMEFVLPAGFEKLSYYGLGENENYPDRQMSAFMGVYETTVTAQHFPFCPPSACGGHGNTRWLTLIHESGNRITFTGYSPFHFDALHNTIADYQNALHGHELPVRPETYLHIDAAHGGIGSNMSWSSHADPSQLVKATAHGVKFMIRVG